MEDTQTAFKTLDFYTANRDWAGDRKLTDNHEIVQFHNNSSVRVWCNEQDEDFDFHWHTALEIIMPTENYYDVESCENSYHILPGELLVIPPGELHKLMAPETGTRFIFLFNIMPIMKLNGFSGIQPLFVRPLYINGETHPQICEDIVQLLLQIRNEYFSENEYGELTICSLLLNFFTKLAYNHLQEKEFFPNVRQSRQKEYVKKFNELLDYIDTHYTEDITLDGMAFHIGFSKFHFSRLFKQYTGLTFNDYLNYRRIKAAEEMLADPGLTITEVSLQSGYSSISTFNRLFKQYKHCTPSEYRSKNREALRHVSPAARSGNQA